MMGMGMRLTPEQQKQVQERSAQRKEEIIAHRAKFEGKTVEEVRAEMEKEHGHHHHHDGEECDCGHEHSEAPDFSFEESDIDEDAVLNYIRSRQDVLDRARRTCKSQHAEIEHLKNQLAISEKKVSALQIGLANLREQLKAAKEAAAEAAPADGPVQA